MTSAAIDLVAVAHQQLRAADPYAVIELLAGHDPTLAAQVYRALQRDLYWTHKDLPATVAVSQAGIQHALTAPASADLRGAAKQLAYNLGSFTWPGWDEPAIPIGAADLAVGRAAANLNLRLAVDLARPPDIMANALWLVGAHRMAAGHLAAAADAFRSADAQAARAGSAVLGQMLRAYAALAELLVDWTNGAAAERLTVEWDALADEGSDDALEYARQIRVARN